MKLTPLDIHNKEFRRSIRGYNEEEVDLFLDQVAEEFEALFKENVQLKEYVQGMKDKVNQYEGVEQTLQRALLTAQQAAEAVQTSAKQESDLIIQDAEGKAREIIAHIQSEKDALQRELDNLRHTKQEFKDKFKKLLGDYLEAVGRIETGVSSREVETGSRGEQPGAGETAPVHTAVEAKPVDDQPVAAAEGTPVVSDEVSAGAAFYSEPKPQQAIDMAEGTTESDGAVERAPAVAEEPAAQAAELIPDSAAEPASPGVGADFDLGSLDYGAQAPDIGAPGQQPYEAKPPAAEDTAVLDTKLDMAFQINIEPPLDLGQPKTETPVETPAEQQFKITLSQPQKAAAKPTDPPSEEAVFSLETPAGQTPDETQEEGPEQPPPTMPEVVSSFFDDDLGVDEDEKNR